MILVFLTGGLEPPRLVRHEARRPRGHPRRVQADRRRACPGIQFCEHLPLLAARADRLAVVRSMSHAIHEPPERDPRVLTGHSQPGAFFDKIASRDDYPCYASAPRLPPARGPTASPAGVMLPTFLMEGPLIWPGQHAGFLGPKHDPWQIRQDPNRPGFRVDEPGAARSASASSG